MNYQEYKSKREDLYTIGYLRIKSGLTCNDIQEELINLSKRYYSEIPLMEGSQELKLNPDQIKYFINTLGKYCKLNKSLFDKQEVFLSKYQDNKHEWNQFLELNLNSGVFKIDFNYKNINKVFFNKLFKFLQSI